MHTELFEIGTYIGRLLQDSNMNKFTYNLVL